MKSETYVCACCGAVLPLGRETALHDALICPDCLVRFYRECDCCHHWFATEDLAETDELALCSSCREQYYTTCARCNRLIPLEQVCYTHDEDAPYWDEPLCEDCCARVENADCIHSYSYKPEPIFYGDGSRFYGVELEIDEGGRLHRNAREFLETANQLLETLYIKTDSSLSDGLELVSHPCTLQFHRETLPWAAILEQARALGYKSHMSGTCGLHVHVNRDSFGDCDREQEEVIGRILFLVEKFWDELLIFSRRTRRQLEQWAARYGRKDSPKEALSHAKSSYASRYTCVNLTNYATIEFRMFRGTLKPTTFLATLELVDRLCQTAMTLSDEEVCALSWSAFVSRLRQAEHPELVEYLKQKRLYVNDAVAAEEEV